MSRDVEQRPATSNEICSSPSRFESRRERRDLIELQWFRVWASNYAPEGLSQQLQIIARPSLANESVAFGCKQPHVVISITNFTPCRIGVGTIALRRYLQRPFSGTASPTLPFLIADSPHRKWAWNRSGRRRKRRPLDSMLDIQFPRAVEVLRECPTIRFAGTVERNGAAHRTIFGRRDRPFVQLLWHAEGRE
jgi:hypothetical protein